jgi:hypothetical protein
MQLSHLFPLVALFLFPLAQAQDLCSNLDPVETCQSWYSWVAKSAQTNQAILNGNNNGKISCNDVLRVCGSSSAIGCWNCMCDTVTSPQNITLIKTWLVVCETYATYGSYHAAQCFNNGLNAAAGCWDQYGISNDFAGVQCGAPSSIADPPGASFEPTSACPALASATPYMSTTTSGAAGSVTKAPTSSPSSSAKPSSASHGTAEYTTFATIIMCGLLAGLISVVFA